jgi:hypothetical protein
VNREKKIGKRTRKNQFVCLLFCLSIRREERERKRRGREDTCGLKVVVLDEMTTMLVVVAKAEKNEATGK